MDQLSVKIEVCQTQSMHGVSYSVLYLSMVIHTLDMAIATPTRKDCVPVCQEHILFLQCLLEEDNLHGR